MAKRKSHNKIDTIEVKRIIVIVASIIALIAIIATVYWIIEAPKTGRLNIVVAPVSSSIEVGGKRLGNGNHHIEPGTYDVKITKDGFSSYEAQVTIEDGKTENIYICLQKNEGNEEYYSSHEEDANACYQVEEYTIEKLEGEKYSDPIFKVAPYHSYTKGFYIDPYLDEEDQVHIKITLKTCIAERAEGLKKNSHEWLSARGIDVDKYQIEYSSCAYGD